MRLCADCETRMDQARREGMIGVVLCGACAARQREEAAPPDLRQRLAERAHDDGMETTAVRDEDLDALIDASDLLARFHERVQCGHGVACEIGAVLVRLGYEHP